MNRVYVIDSLTIYSLFSSIVVVFTLYGIGRSLWDGKLKTQELYIEKIYLQQGIKYLSIFFIQVIIVVVTVRVGDDKNLSDYISFAGTLSSIILSVLAIFITVQSDNRSASTKVSLDQAAYSVTEATTSLNEIKNKIDEDVEHHEDILNKVDKIYEMISIRNRDITDNLNLDNESIEDIKDIKNFKISDEKGDNHE